MLSRGFGMTSPKSTTITRPNQLEALAGSTERRFVLGGGSNVVLTGDFPGLILHMAIPGRELASEDADAWYVRAGAGEPWHEFVQWTLAQGWPGLENLSLIPGTVGAAPVQNIGAYGLEVGDRLRVLRVRRHLHLRPLPLPPLPTGDRAEA